MAHSERFLSLVQDALTRVPEISPSEVAQKQDSREDFILIDTREDSEWAAGHVAGAIHLGKGIIERDIEGIAPDTDTALILYCGGGFRSVLAGDALRKMGYTNVKSMSEGWRGWKEKGLPIETP